MGRRKGEERRPNTKAMVLGLAARACSVCILLTLAFLTLVNVSLSSSEPTCGARDKAMGSIGRANVNTLNVLGGMLERCSRPGGPVTGFYRDGCCTTGENDLGRHTVCSRMTAAFLSFTRERGNDLSSPAPHYGFPGLKPGDQWCLCAPRWKEAFEHGVAPPVVLEATHEAALQIVSLEALRDHAFTRETETEL